MNVTRFLSIRLAVWLPPVLASGCAAFAWSLSGDAGFGLPGKMFFAVAAAMALLASWLLESVILSRIIQQPLADVSRKVAVSLLPFLVLPLSTPYISHRVFSSFLRLDPSLKRLAVLTVWLLLIAAAGSFFMQLVLFWRRADRVTALLERNAVRILWGGAAFYFLTFATLAIVAYSQYRYHSDLAQYNQTLWATLRGRLFYSSVEETSESFLSTHVSPFLLMILPLYALRQSPVTILVLRSLALALAAVPLFYCVRRITGNGVAGLLLSAAFLFHPEIVAQHFTSGYEVVFVAVFFFAAYYFFNERRFGWFMLFLIMVLTVREDFVTVALVFAIYALIKHRPWKWVVVPLVAWAVWQLAVMLIFNATIEHWVFNLYYGHFGGSPLQMVKTIITHPVYTFEEVWRLQKSYLYSLLMPLGFVLPWTSLVSIFALPNLALILARSDDVSLAAGGITHYSVLVVAALWLGLANFIRRAQRWTTGKDGSMTAIMTAIVVTVLVASSAHTWMYLLPSDGPPEAAALDQAIQMIPADASVSSNDGRVFPRLSSRWGLYEPLVWDVLQEPDRIPQGVEQLKKGDYIILKQFGGKFYNDEAAFSFVFEPGSGYRLIFEESGIRVFER